MKNKINSINYISGWKCQFNGYSIKGWVENSPNPIKDLFVEQFDLIGSCFFWKNIKLLALKIFISIFLTGIVMGLGQKFLTRVGSAIFRFVKFPLKISNFSIFFTPGQKNFFGLGQKVPGSKADQLLIHCWSKLCWGHVGLGQVRAHAGYLKVTSTQQGSENSLKPHPHIDFLTCCLSWDCNEKMSIHWVLPCWIHQSFQQNQKSEMKGNFP